MAERLYHQAAASFEAARRIPVLAPGHRARRLHGHGFKARVLAELAPAWGGFDGAETEALAAALAASVAALDYSDLNERLAVPTDAHLAAWVQAQLEQAQAVPGIAQVGIQSTGEQGVELSLGADAAGARCRRAHVWRRFRFEAAHRLVNVPPAHQCGRMHGHGFEVILHAEQAWAPQADGLNSAAAHSGIDLDGDQLGALWAPLHGELDHACLNDLPGLENPTSELLAAWIWQRLKPRLPALSVVSVYETATAGCQYDGQSYRIWKELRFEGALRLTQAPAGDPRRRLHGHSYLLRLHLTAPLDAVLGWTIDYGDVKALFEPVYARLDHHPLNALSGLSDPSAARLAGWIRESIADVLPQADRLELSERPGCGVLLGWGDRCGAGGANGGSASAPRAATLLPLG